MLRIAGEVQLNSPAQVRDWLAEALAIVEDADVELELRVPAFLKVFELLSAKHCTIDQVAGVIPNMTIPRG